MKRTALSWCITSLVSSLWLDGPVTGLSDDSGSGGTKNLALCSSTCAGVGQRQNLTTWVADVTLVTRNTIIAWFVIIIMFFSIVSERLWQAKQHAYSLHLTTCIGVVWLHRLWTHSLCACASSWSGLTEVLSLSKVNFSLLRKTSLELGVMWVFTVHTMEEGFLCQICSSGVCVCVCVCVVYLCSTLQPTRDGTLGVMGEGAHHDVWRPPRDTKVNTAVRRVCTVHQAGQSSDEHFIRFVCGGGGGGIQKMAAYRRHKGHYSSD